MTLEKIAALTGARLVGDPDYPIRGIADLESAQPDQVSFLANPRYAKAAQRSRAGAILVPPEAPLALDRQWLVCDSPSSAFQQLVDHFYPADRYRSGFTGVHPSAVIHPTAQVDPSAQIGPLCVVDRGAQIGPRTVLIGQVWIGAETTVGADCTLHPGVVVREGCRLGDRCILQPGVVLGGCGYGYSTNSLGQHQKLAQRGGVILEDEVEVGANSTIDRARFGETRIGAGSKIDNLVMVAHGVTTGQRCLVVAQTGIAGSTRLGDQVTLGGQSACVGHIELGSNVVLAARGGATKSISKPGVYAGNPAIPMRDYHRREAHLNTVADLKARLAQLEQQVTQLLSQADAPEQSTRAEE